MAPNSTIPRVAKRVRLLLRAAQRSDGNTEKHEAEHEGYDQRDERHHGPTDVQSEREDADSEDHGELGDAHPDAGQRFAQHDLQRRGGARRSRSHVAQPRSAKNANVIIDTSPRRSWTARSRCSTA
jgi:hypothetical protein